MDYSLGRTLEKAGIIILPSTQFRDEIIAETNKDLQKSKLVSALNSIN